MSLFASAYCAPARADSAFANIDITRYVPSDGGMEFKAEYTIDPDTLCPCPPENIRWLQLVQLTDSLTGKPKLVGEFPYTTFIDPQMNQPGGPFDEEPWYDYTYNSDADRTDKKNQQNGAGAFFVDYPTLNDSDAPIQFKAYTILVCIGENQTATFLGGFTWGFTFSRDMVTRSLDVMPLSDSQNLRNMFNNGPGGLEASYDWTLAADADPDDCPVTVSEFGKAVVPAPESFLAGAILCASLTFGRARRKITI
ncbi:MAG TPA: hypothetical protein VG722_05075 [Tepidisphaeraceae bacterium]|nr:hypothetical protein [Tepidisphaeraceae bacterium]